MITTLITAVLFSANFDLSATSSDGTRFYIDVESIAKISNDDIWSFEMKSESTTGKTDGKCIFSPQQNEYAVVSSGKFIGLSEARQLVLSPIEANSMIHNILERASELILLRKDQFRLDSVASPQFKNYWNSLIGKWEIVGTSFVKPPKKISDTIYELWITDVYESGIIAHQSAKDFRAVARKTRNEYNLSRSKQRVCDIWIFDKSGAPLFSDSGCADWSATIPDSRGEKFENFIKESIGTKKKEERHPKKSSI